MPVCGCSGEPIALPPWLFNKVYCLHVRARTRAPAHVHARIGIGRPPRQVLLENPEHAKTVIARLQLFGVMQPVCRRAVSARRVCSCLVHSFFRSTRTVCGGACGARECVCVLVLVRCHCSLTCCALSACCGLDLCKHILYLHLFFSASRCQSHVHDRKWSRCL